MPYIAWLLDLDDKIFLVVLWWDTPYELIDSKVIDQSEQIYQNSNSFNQCILLAFGQILTLFRNYNSLTINKMVYTKGQFQLQIKPHIITHISIAQNNRLWSWRVPLCQTYKQKQAKYIDWNYWTFDKFAPIDRLSWNQKWLSSSFEMRHRNLSFTQYN